MKKLLSYETKVNYATKNSPSLKTGFPREISDILDINAGESLEWCVNLFEEKILITVQKSDKKE